MDNLPSPLTKLALAFAGGVTIFMVVAAVLIGGYQYSFMDRIYPGVSVAGIDVSGLTQAEAEARLADELIYPGEGTIAFQDKNTVWTAAPVQLGFFLDARTSAYNAYQVGRSSHPSYGYASQFADTRLDLPPSFVFDQRVALDYLQGLANYIDVPTIEATLGLDGVEVLVHDGQVGRQMDIMAALNELTPTLQMLQDGLIDLEVEEDAPVILDASAQAEIARQILSAPLVIRDPDAETAVEWVIEPETLAKMLTIERVPAAEGGEAYQITVSSSKLRDFLNNLAPGLSVTPENARFIFNDDTRELEVIQDSVTGRELLVEESVGMINQKLAEGEHQIDLVFDYILPEASSTATAADLGITELVSSQTSYFYGSSTSRIQNITVAASRFHGILIPPGAIFSMADVLGDINLDNGYAEALIIFGDRTIKGVGGGVCQVSTTLFRTVFFGGYEINERWSHAYRVVYYELSASGSYNTNLAGLDATVYVPLVDFKFTNDSDNWLLMETYVSQSARTLTWKFYSTSDGRSMEWNTTGLQNKVDPPDPLYEENASLSKGEINQVDWAVAGADVTVTRVVYRNGQAIHEDVFTTHYQPWRAVYQYGPGTKLPKGAETQGN